MRITATGFSHRGTIRQQNEDAILMHTDVFHSGTHRLEIENTARFFVADGVGGAPAGEVASKFVLNQLNKKVEPETLPDKEQLMKTVRSINTAIFEYSSLNPQYAGMATTLSGLFISGENYRVYNCGDSCTLLFRDQKLQQITTSDIMELYPDTSMLANYFGGYHDALLPKVSAGVSQLIEGDVFIVTTDGIFHCFPFIQLEKILTNSKPLHEKALMILEKSLDMGAPDNISCIFISITA